MQSSTPGYSLWSSSIVAWLVGLRWSLVRIRCTASSVNCCLLLVKLTRGSAMILSPEVVAEFIFRAAVAILNRAGHATHSRRGALSLGPRCRTAPERRRTSHETSPSRDLARSPARRLGRYRNLAGGPAGSPGVVPGPRLLGAGGRSHDPRLRHTGSERPPVAPGLPGRGPAALAVEAPPPGSRRGAPGAGTGPGYGSPPTRRRGNATWP